MFHFMIPIVCLLSVEKLYQILLHICHLYTILIVTITEKYYRLYIPIKMLKVKATK